MKIFLWIFFGIAILIFVIWGFTRFDNSSKNIVIYSTDDPNAPKMEITEKYYDFGKITLQDVVRHNFSIKNIGKDPLVISDVVTSCHCASAIIKIPDMADSPEFGMHFDKKWQGSINSGEEASVEVIYTPAKMPVRGLVKRVVTLQTNDPLTKEVQFEISAEVQ